MTGKQKTPKPRLAVTIDGAEQSEEQARATWEAFSAWMDAHVGDEAGFARERGYASATPTFEKGRAVLVIKNKKSS